MTARLAALRRVLAVQDQVKRIADWRLAEAERSAAEVGDAQAALAGFLDAAAVVGPLALLAQAQARRLDAREAAVAGRVAAEADAMRDAAARQKLLAKAVDVLARDEAALRERKDLERLADTCAGRAGAADPDG